MSAEDVARQQRYDDRRARLAATIDALPPRLHWFVCAWRHHIAAAGRVGGSELELLEQFVRDVKLTFAPPPPVPPKVAGEHATGSGV